ncbi:trypsin-like peptidase domain-containing protein [Psychrosphaera aestuarii]|uniref:trypsin-like peptidase domain-containing protein n=1 Tax=Psychrosphaera aestuarii TaxID=1266052 RepID=UPI001B327DA0|nr:trypsin-like peptidase domain-containing protein [Psychrosphaera aestuarii]
MTGLVNQFCGSRSVVALYALLCVIFTPFLVSNAQAHEPNKLIELANATKQSVVGVGVYNPLSAPRYQLRGTGFVVSSNATSSIIATNHHVVNGDEYLADKAQISVHVGESTKARFYNATLIAQDERADVAIIKIDAPLPAMQLSGAKYNAPAGSQIMMAGLPIGSVLGLFKAINIGYVSAFVPQAIPQQNASQLSIEMIKRLRDPLFVYQLDVTAYPGNSGSPVVEVKSGKVIAIINSVLVKKTRESVLSDPSGISYAIPVSEIHELLKQVPQ